MFTCYVYPNGHTTIEKDRFEWEMGTHFPRQAVALESDVYVITASESELAFMKSHFRGMRWCSGTDIVTWVADDAAFIYSNMYQLVFQRTGHGFESQHDEDEEDDDSDSLEPTQRDQLTSIKAALHTYHNALDTRQHGGVAAGKLADELESILNTPWRQGATLKGG